MLVINYVIDRFKRTNGQVNSAFILTSKKEYIEKDYLKNNYPGLSITFPKSSEEINTIPLIGCLNYPAFKNNSSKPTRIEYWSGGERIYIFESFDKFIEHWRSVKPLANQDNTYRMIYSEKVQKEVKMKDLNHEFELGAYKF